MFGEGSERPAIGKWLAFGVIGLVVLGGIFNFCFVTHQTVNAQKQAIDQRQDLEEAIRAAQEINQSSEIDRVDLAPERLRGMFR